MIKYRVTVTLNEPVILSQDTSTTGHASLDFIPGSVLLGVLASKVYRHNPQALNDKLFHTSAVEFGNAYPSLDGHTISQPIPLSWHHVKGRQYKQDGILQAQELKDFSLKDSFKDEQQPKQLRGNYLDKYGRWLSVNKQQCMKTAIDGDSGVAAESQLYAYEALSVGQVFIGEIRVNDNDQDLQTNLQQLVGIHRIGRAKSSEFGEVQIDLEQIEHDETFTSLLGQSTLRLYCASDLILLNHLAMPTTEPSAEMFGLEGELVLEQTYIRAGQYTSYNGYRRSYDQTMLTIAKGSVLTFSLTQGLTSQQAVLLSKSFGLETQLGFGMLAPVPKLTFADKEVAHQVETSPEPKVLVAPTPFTQWLDTVLTNRSQQQDNQAKVKQLINEQGAIQLYQNARVYLGASAGEAVGPSSSQWGRVLEVAKRVNIDNDTLLKLLFVGNDAICKENDPDWHATTFTQNTQTTFRDWLQGVLSKHPVEAAQYLAKLMSSSKVQHVRNGMTNSQGSEHVS